VRLKWSEGEQSGEGSRASWVGTPAKWGEDWRDITTKSRSLPLTWQSKSPADTLHGPIPRAPFKARNLVPSSPSKLTSLTLARLFPSSRRFLSHSAPSSTVVYSTYLCLPELAPGSAICGLIYHILEMQVATGRDLVSERSSCLWQKSAGFPMLSKLELLAQHWCASCKRWESVFRVRPSVSND
jgi:hypothetical protein